MDILVLHPGALGDIILSLPALGLMRRLWPGSRLTLAANSDFADTVAAAAADRLMSLSTVPLHRLRSDAPLPAADRLFWGSYGRVLSWTGAGDSEFEAGLMRANTNSRTAAWRPRAGETRHVSRLFADILGPWLSPGDSLPPAEIAVPAEGLESARAWLQSRAWSPDEDLLAVHPGAGGRQKRWPLGRYAELIRTGLSAAGRRVVAIEGPAEKGVCEELTRALPPDSVAEASGLPLATVAGVLSLCRAYVGNDSGVTHLAAALGLPTVALFGPTLPELWAPLGRRVRVLRQAASCRRCGGAAKAAHSCMDAIQVRSVMTALEAVQSISIPPFTSIDSPCR